MSKTSELLKSLSATNGTIQAPNISNLKTTGTSKTSKLLESMRTPVTPSVKSVTENQQPTIYDNKPQNIYLETPEERVKASLTPAPKKSFFSTVKGGLNTFWNELTKVPTAEEMQKVKDVQAQAEINDPLNQWKKQRELKKSWNESIKNRPMETVQYTDPETGKLTSKQLPKATLVADTRYTKEETEAKLNELNIKSSKIEQDKKNLDTLKVDETNKKSVEYYNNKIKLYNEELSQIKKESENLNIQLAKGIIPEGPSPKDQIMAQYEYLNNKSMRSDIGLIKKANLFMDKSSYETERGLSNVAIGALQSTKSMVDGLQWISDATFSKITGEDIKSNNYLAKKMNNWSLSIEESTGITDYNRNFADSLMQGVGSAASFFLPGLGIMKGAGFFGKVSPKLASWFANSASTALEATAEAGSVFEEVYAKTGDRNKAGTAATKTFWANAILIFLTNKAGGVFENYSTNMIKKALIAAPSEGLQEYGQQIVSNYSSEKPLTEGANESAFIGGLLGFAMGLIGSPTVRERYSEEEKKVDNIISNVIDKTESIKNEKSKDFKSIKIGVAIDNTPGMRQEVNDVINSVGPIEAHSILKEELGLDSKTAFKVIENVTKQNSVENQKNIPETDIMSKAVKRADLVQEEESKQEMTKVSSETEKLIKTMREEGSSELEIAQAIQKKYNLSIGKAVLEMSKYPKVETKLPGLDSDESLIEDAKKYDNVEEFIQGSPFRSGTPTNDALYKAVKNGDTKTIKYLTEIWNKAQGEAKMKISEKVSHEDKIKISKLLDGLDTTPLTVDGKPDLKDTELYFRLDQLKTKNEKGKLTNEEYIEAKGLLEEAKLGLDTLKTKEDNKTYGENKTTTNGEVQNNIRDLRQGDEGGTRSYSLENRSKDGNIRSLGGQDESGKRVENSRIPQGKSTGEVRRIAESVFPEAQPEVIDEIILSNIILNNIGIELEIQRSDTLNGRTDFDAGIQNGKRTSLLTLNNKYIATIKKNAIWHEVFGHKWYQNLTDQQKELHFNKIKELYNSDKTLFDKFLAKEYWEAFASQSIRNDIINANPGTSDIEIDKILVENGFLTENNEVIYPENILDTVFNFTPMSDKLNKYLRENGYNPSTGVLEYNNLMGEEINSYVAENAEIFKDSTIPEISQYSNDILNGTIKLGDNLGFGGQRFKLRQSTGLTSEDIIKKHANIQLKRDIVITDVYGEKATLKAGEGITPYEVTGNKFILQDGEAYLVSKSQAQNVINNSKTGEVKPFAPELKQTEETIKGGNDPFAGLTKEDLKQQLIDYDEDPTGMSIDEMKAKLIDINENDMGTAFNKEASDTKYSQYTLPGGTNYKEILIKAPMESTYDGTRQSLFKSSHWEEPNVISHIRMNERTYNGKKVAFMEELQSDWAREGRDKGFQSMKEDFYSIDKELSKLQDDLAEKYKEDDFSKLAKLITPEEKAKWNSLTEQRNKLYNQKDGVPYNPLLKNWQELSIKRALQEAVNTNAKYFAWITGEQTSARYNLATYLDNVVWEKTNTGKTIALSPKGGSEMNIEIDKDGTIQERGRNIKNGWQGKKLDEVLGKGLADKIMADESGTLSGDGLSFGGEWAKNLYDKQVKAIVENLTGQKVEMLDMGLAIDKRATKWRITKQKGFEMFADTDIILDESNIQVGDTVTNLGSRIEDIKDTDKYVITDILGNGKFKAITKEAVYDSKIKPEYTGQTFKKIENTDLKYDNKTYQEQTFDISEKTTQQMGIEITPEVKAIIKGEAPQVKVSGKLPFTEQITAPVMFKLKAPSNLTEEQQRIVRTPEFKNWFGDWENDPANASKIVDENGEPLVVYHGSRSEKFEEFNPKYIGNRDSGWFGKGFYFALSKGEAGTYGKNITDVYLNIKKPFDFSKYDIEGYRGSSLADTYTLSKMSDEITGLNTAIKGRIYGKGDESTDFNRIGKEISLGQYKRMVENENLTPKPVEVNDRGKVTISYRFNDIYGNEQWYDTYGTKPIPNELLKYVLFDKKHETNFDIGGLYGVERKIADYYGDEFTNELKKLGYDGTIQSPYGDEYVAFESNQIKSATGNTTFGPTGNIMFKIKLPEVNTGSKLEDAKQILAHVENKLGVDSVSINTGDKKVDEKINLEAKEDLIEIKSTPRKIKVSGVGIELSPELQRANDQLEMEWEYLDQNPLKYFWKYANKKEGTLPEVSGKKDDSIFGRMGDELVNREDFMRFVGSDGFIDTELIRDKFYDYFKEKKDFYERQKIHKAEVKKYINAQKDEIGIQKIREAANKKMEADIQQMQKDRARLLKNIEMQKKMEETQARIRKEQEIEQARIANINRGFTTPVEEMKWWQRLITQPLNPLKYTDKKTQNIFQNWNKKILEGRQRANKEASEFVKIPISEGPDVIWNYENGKQTKYSSEIKQKFDSLQAEARRRGVDMGFRENYLPHIYKEDAQEIKEKIEKYLLDKGLTKEQITAYENGTKLPEAITNVLKINPFFSKERIFPTYQVAMQYGITPKYSNPAQLIGYYIQEMETIIANNELVQELESEGKILPFEDAPLTWEMVNLPFSQKGYNAPKNIAKVINGLFTHQEPTGWTFVSKISKKMQEIKLSAGLPYTTVNFFAIGAGLIKEVTAGNFKAINAFFRANFNNKSIKWMQENRKYMEMMAHQGINQRETLDSWENLYTSLKNIDGFMGKSGEVFDQAFGDKTFMSFMPMLQIQLFKDSYNKLIDKGYPQEIAEELAGRIVSNNFGLSDFSGRSKVTQDKLSAIFFAPQFREGIINSLTNTGKAGYDLVKNLGGLRSPLDPTLVQNRKLLIGMTITFLLYNLLNAYLNDDGDDENGKEWMWNNPKNRKFALQIPTDDGTLIYVEFMPSYLAFARNMFSGAIGLGTGDFETAGQKFGSVFSMPIKTTTEILSNSDYFGNPIYKETDTGLQKSLKVAKYLGLSVNHPYITEVINQIQDKKPLYQSIIIGLELPLKFSSWDKVKQGEYYDALDAKAKENAQIKNKIKPTYDKVQELKDSGKIKEATDLYNTLTEDQKIVFNKIKQNPYDVKQVKNDVYEEAIKSLKTKSLGEVQKNIAKELYGDKPTNDQKSTVNKEFAYYREYDGYKYKKEADEFKGLTNENKILFLKSLKKKISPEAYQEFLAKGRKSVRLSSGKSSPLLISDEVLKKSR